MTRAELHVKAHVYRILVIDDETAIHDNFKMMLAPNPGVPADKLKLAREQNFPLFEIDCASTGEEGLNFVQKALAENRPYTMAFVDLRMKTGWNGLETIGHIWKECSDLQIIICTGHMDYSWHRIIEQFGHTHRLLVLKKPFDITEVRQMAYALAEKWNLARQAQRQVEQLQKLVAERTAKLEETNRSLRAERDYIDQIIQKTPALIVGVTPNGATTFINPAVSRHTGYSAEELIGKNWWQLLYPADEYRQVEQFFRDFEQGLLLDYEMVLTTKTGAKRVVSWNSVRRNNEAGNAEEIIGFGNDISERKKAETERRSMEIQLRQAQKMESVGRLAAGIAHEISTPTQYIGDNLRFLQSSFADLKLLHKQYEKLFEAAKSGAANHDLIAQTEETIARTELDFLAQGIPKSIQQSLEGLENVARIVRAMNAFSHPDHSEKTPVDLNKAIDATLIVARHEWKNVAEIVKELDEKLPRVPCFTGSFNQVILNLVVNAAHAIADKRSAGKGTITITTRNCGDWAEIRVKDTGTGIRENIRDKIFDPFFTTKPLGKGTGQGLAIAHAVMVDQHGGQLSFETEIGVGSVFIIRLPIRASAAKKFTEQKL